MTTTKFEVGDKVMGLGRRGAIWRRKPIGTVTKVHTVLGDNWVRVQWDRSAVEDDMEPADLLAVVWMEDIGRYATLPR
jgi:hypothetical protein